MLATRLRLLVLLALPVAAQAQTARDLTDIGLELYQQANSPGAYLLALNQPGVLVLPNMRRRQYPPRSAARGTEIEKAGTCVQHRRLMLYF